MTELISQSLLQLFFITKAIYRVRQAILFDRHAENQKLKIIF